MVMWSDGLLLLPLVGDNSEGFDEFDEFGEADKAEGSVEKSMPSIVVARSRRSE